ncbi:MAG: N-acetylmuramoyl-L-alanine amidase [Acidimicrobiia bacterium]
MRAVPPKVPGVRARLLAPIVVVAVAVLGPVAGAQELVPGGTFVDDDSSVHEPAIEALVAAGITSGCSTVGPRFCPDAPVTRGQMAAFLRRALQLPSVPAGVGFLDMDGSVFVDDVGSVADVGITRGCDPPANSRFCPEADVTRGQMAAFLARGLGLDDAAPGGRFVDSAGSVFASDIDRVAAAGITLGCNPPDNDRFCPDDVVTRGQMATFLARALYLAVGEVPVRPATVEVVAREAWGAEPARDGFGSHDINQLTVHHSGSPASGVSGPQAFQGWQAYHFSLGWPDLAYHFIVGRDGQVYEGRPYTAPGDTATDYDPSGHFLVVVEGDYRTEQLDADQFEAMARVFAWAAVEFDVSPETISGHRDHASTSCPGGNIQRFIDDGSLERRVAELVEAGGVSMVLG